MYSISVVAAEVSVAVRSDHRAWWEEIGEKSSYPRVKSNEWDTKVEKPGISEEADGEEEKEDGERVLGMV